MTTETMNIIITSVLIPFLVALVALFVQFTSAKAAELKTRLHNEEVSEATRLHNEEVDKYVDIAEDAVIKAVGAVSQVIVDTLKEMAVDGQLTESEKAQAFTEARNRALLIMGLAGKAAVTELYGSFDDWIDNTIQYYVRLQKPQEPVVTTIVVETPPVGETTTITTGEKV